MANQPQQLPNIDLPGAEYFALAPNRTIAIQSRRRLTVNSAAISVPANSTGTIVSFTTALETGFTNTSGIYLHRLATSFFPTANSAGIGINAVTVGFTVQSPVSPGVPDYPLGVPISTNLSPQIGIALLVERDLLVTARDLTFDVLANSGTLSLTGAAMFTSTAAGALTVLLSTKVIWSRLDGFTE